MKPKFIKLKSINLLLLIFSIGILIGCYPEETIIEEVNKTEESVDLKILNSDEWNEVVSYLQTKYGQKTASCEGVAFFQISYHGIMALSFYTYWDNDKNEWRIQRQDGRNYSISHSDATSLCAQQKVVSASCGTCDGSGYVSGNSGTYDPCTDRCCPVWTSGCGDRI